MPRTKIKRDTIYLKIWEQNYGSIPKDSEGRRMEIHHIDGNKPTTIYPIFS